MPFKISTKLIIAFFAVIFPFIAIVGAIAIYNTNTIRNVSLKEETITEEMQLIMSLQLAIDKSLMPGNDYIITGDRKYIDEFNNASRDVDGLIKEMEGISVRLKGMEAPKIKEETEILKSVRTAWQNIKEDSQRIFEIPNPIGNKEAARLMEEMDYKWGYPLIKVLDKHREIDRKEHAEAVEELHSVWRMAWIIMIGGAVILITFGGFFALFYSKLFTRPIQALHNGADAIAGGNFKTRLDIKTGDEFEQLSNAMNDMAAQLDNLYETLEQRIEERTIELKESETRFRGIVETAKDAMICISEDGIIYMWNKSAEEMFGYSDDEAIDKEIHSLIVPERFREKAKEGFKTFLHTGTGRVIGKLIELIGLKKDGAEFPVELSVAAMNIHGKRHAVGIIRDITERKQAEEKLRETRDYLENLFNYANAPIIVWDPSFRITIFNHAFERMTGRDASEVIGKEIDVLFPADRKDEALSHIRQTKTGERWETVEIPILHSSGEVRTALWNSATLYSTDGKTVVATIAQGQDITERKKAEKELQERIEILERFRNATVQREFRIKEMRDENEELKRKLGIHKV